MKLLKAIFASIILAGSVLALNSGAFATSTEEITMRFTIEKMNCPLCPITVRKSMENVPGVKQVEVDYDMKIATVIFDPALTTKNAIADASTKIGYPASILADNTE